MGTVNAHHHGDRTKGLLVVDLHVGFDVIEDGGRHHSTRRHASADQLGALVQRILQHVIDAIARFGADHGADDASRIDRRIAGTQFIGSRGKLGHEFIGHFFVHHQAFGRHADLALIKEGAKNRSLDGFVHVGIVEHHQRRLATQFQQAALEVLG